MSAPTPGTSGCIACGDTKGLMTVTLVDAVAIPESWPGRTIPTCVDCRMELEIGDFIAPNVELTDG